MSSWADRAACRGYPTDWWFPAPGDTLAAGVARSICRTCPVRQACLDEALEVEVAGGRFGIRAGLNPRQRTVVARRPQPAPMTTAVATTNIPTNVTPMIVRTRRPYAAAL